MGITRFKPTNRLLGLPLFGTVAKILDAILEVGGQFGGLLGILKSGSPKGVGLSFRIVPFTYF